MRYTIDHSNKKSLKFNNEGNRQFIGDTRTTITAALLPHYSCAQTVKANVICDFCLPLFLTSAFQLRSKYCAHLGFVIARFDHYCIWLNNSIGFRNHLTFIIFLMSHLLTSLFAIALLLRLVQVLRLMPTF